MTHRDEAEAHLGMADGAAMVSDHRGAEASHQAALTHALLEIGEQLRVANQITLTKYAVEQYGNYAPQGVNLPSLFKPPLTEQGNMLINTDIATALRLDGDPQ